MISRAVLLVVFCLSLYSTASALRFCRNGPLPYSGLRARVLGAGVIGLTNAVMLQRVGFSVTIHAKTTPFNYDPTTDSDPYYASAKAAGWIFGEDLGFYWESTFDAFTGYAALYPLSGVGMFETRDYFAKNLTSEEFDDYTPYKSYAKGFRVLNETELDALRFPNGTRMFEVGVAWKTPIVVTLTYLKLLMNTFFEQGGSFVHEEVRRISDLTSLPNTDLVVISPGIGARTLGELMDHNVIPEKGQVLVVRQPNNESLRINTAVWVDFWPEVTYIIPHVNNEIFLGGTYEFNVSTLNVQPSVIAGILQRTSLIEPILSNLPIIRQYACLRPLHWNATTEDDSPRIETEPHPAKFGGVPVIYAYGHGGEGFEGSWGTAWEVINLVKNIRFSCFHGDDDREDGDDHFY